MEDFVFYPNSLTENIRNLPCGWLSPQGKMYECSYMEHLILAEKLAKESGAKEEDLYDEYLLNHNWVHLTFATFIDHGWTILFPYKAAQLTQEQHNFLKPYIEENIDFISDISKTDLKYEFEELKDLFE